MLSRFDWLRHGFGTRHSAPVEGQIATLRQIHSVRVVRAEGRAGVLGEGDALIGNTPGVLLGIKTADCLPILLVDAQRRAVAAVHAGWRGTSGGIMAETIAAMASTFGSAPEDLHVAIGPGIGGCCFEVGPEVARELVGIERRTHVDLGGMNREHALRAGIPPTHVYRIGICTACNAREFFSYRRERDQAGRMISFIGVAADSKTVRL